MVATLSGGEDDEELIVLARGHGTFSGWLKKTKGEAARAKWMMSRTTRFFTIDFNERYVFYSSSKDLKRISRPIPFADIISCAGAEKTLLLRTRKRVFELLAASEADALQWICAFNAVRQIVQERPEAIAHEAEPRIAAKDLHATAAITDGLSGGALQVEVPHIANVRASAWANPRIDVRTRGVGGDFAASAVASVSGSESAMPGRSPASVRSKAFAIATDEVGPLVPVAESPADASTPEAFNAQHESATAKAASSEDLDTSSVPLGMPLARLAVSLPSDQGSKRGSVEAVHTTLVAESVAAPSSPFGVGTHTSLATEDCEDIAASEGEKSVAVVDAADVQTSSAQDVAAEKLRDVAADFCAVADLAVATALERDEAPSLVSVATTTSIGVSQSILSSLAPETGAPGAGTPRYTVSTSAVPARVIDATGRQQLVFAEAKAFPVHALSAADAAMRAKMKARRKKLDLPTDGRMSD